jgi:hypothetical protein
MGGVCGGLGDVGGELALQDDDGRDGEQWHLRTWSATFSSSRSSGLGSQRAGHGREMREVTPARIHSHVDSQKRGQGALVISSGSKWLCCPRTVRQKVRKKFEFEFLKNSTWSCWGIIQGF